MYDAEFWGEIIKSLIWPLTLIFLLLFFSNQVRELIRRIHTWKSPWGEFQFFQFGDVINPPAVITPPPGETLETKKLSPEEMEASRKRAQARLDEDTKKNGVQRGKLFQLSNGAYAVAWEASATVHIGIK
jgi:hypothetical protein